MILHTLGVQVGIKVRAIGPNTNWNLGCGTAVCPSEGSKDPNNGALGPKYHKSMIWVLGPSGVVDNSHSIACNSPKPKTAHQRRMQVSWHRALEDVTRTTGSCALQDYKA